MQYNMTIVLFLRILHYDVQVKSCYHDVSILCYVNEIILPQTSRIAVESTPDLVYIKKTGITIYSLMTKLCLAQRLDNMA